MSLAKALRTKSITRIDGTKKMSLETDTVAIEEPLEIRVGGRSVAVVMRTPGHDRELAAGFLVSEGIVRRRDEILDIVRCASAERDTGNRAVQREPGRVDAAANRENLVDVLLAPGTWVDWTNLTRHVFTSSSCGICSKASIDAVRLQFPSLTEAARLRPSADMLAGLPEKLRSAQVGFAASGGLHASALFTADGSLEIVREDVGRHNALDKLIGHAFLAEQLPLSGRVLLLSGRVSFELMQKALAAGIASVAAISAPTSAAVEFAEASGQTLVGFLRGQRMNVYAGTLAD
jgi:FdhD protein